MKTQLERMWVDWVVNMMIPRDIQEKIHRTHRLTHDELLLVNRASCAVSDIKKMLASFPDKGTIATDETMRAMFEEYIRPIQREIAHSHRNERKILYYVSDEPERYKDKDGRSINTLKKAVVYMAAKEAYQRPDTQLQPICAKFFFQHHGNPDFYDNLDSFVRQVKRTLKDFRT